MFLGGILALSIILATIAVVGWVSAWLHIRAQRPRTVVNTLAVIVGQNIPLAAGLRAAARAEPPKMRRIFEQMAWRLESGDLVSTALRSAFVSCPGSIVGAIQGGEMGGTLPSVLRSLKADSQRTRSQIGVSAGGVWLLAMLFIYPLVIGFLSVQILPKYKEICRDFQTTMPSLTLMVFELADSAWNHLGWIIVFYGLLITSMLHLLMGRPLLRRVPDRFQPLAAGLDWVTWHTPGLRNVAEARALARQLPLMEAAVHSGQDVPAAARQAACVDANYFARKRLQRWADSIEDGREPIAAAASLGFPAPLLAGLSAGRGGADLGTAFGYLCAYYRSLRVHWERLFASLLTPLVVSFWAVCVGIVVFAVMLPIIALLEAVMNTIH